MNTKSLPLVAITMGDAAGTGPEIITKSLALPELRAVCRPVVIGDAAAMTRALRFTGVSLKIRALKDVAEATSAPGEIDVLDLANLDLATLKLGHVDPQAGHAAYEYIKLATELALAGRVSAVVTSSINKESLNAAGHHFDGHTGLLAHLCDRPDATMMLVADKLRVSHVSTHVPLRVAIDRVKPDRILTVLRLTHDAVRRLGIDRPRLAVAGLNPHAGENGLFGDEEEKFITPAIVQARALGLDVHGPFAGDTIFFRTLQGEFDAGVAMYHDQGHVAAKMLGIWRGVNVTLGLPIIRTSVEHGTDFANAGTGRSDPRSLNEALKLAAAMAAHPNR
ncbi:MAG: 4-hydroxythreonine-4-phosphate dehydrogenase PdxA [Opitutia bacterium Tous-C4FEB]|nr:MAG: 4-hydroxythreonine-4-phosphate dehydrogenase PdxA [Opitutae bacterium Tous-C5TDCM]PAW89479.1 MAG: 4-hydroxythreonine-4-phosphate dehydrogenase PdxA [Opitutae bacterium Tous-C4FEB]